MSPKKTEDDLIAGLERAERARRRRTMLVGGVVAVLVIAAFVISFTFSEELFQPEVDVESGEQQVIADTNDPQCRNFIAHVTRVAAQYFELEPTLQDQLAGDDPEHIRSLLEDVQRLREELDIAEEKAAEANLRFDTSRAEVNDWFRYIDNELNILQKVGGERLEQLGPSEDPDAGTLVQPEQGKGKKSKRTPQERLDGATLAANEAFQKFRVWHTGGLHPCGAAEEGEQPWSPETEK